MTLTPTSRSLVVAGSACDGRLRAVGRGRAVLEPPGRGGAVRVDRARDPRARGGDAVDSERGGGGRRRRGWRCAGRVVARRGDDEAGRVGQAAGDREHVARECHTRDVAVDRRGAERRRGLAVVAEDRVARAGRVEARERERGLACEVGGAADDHAAVAQHGDRLAGVVAAGDARAREPAGAPCGHRARRGDARDLHVAVGRDGRVDRLTGCQHAIRRRVAPARARRSPGAPRGRRRTSCR